MDGLLPIAQMICHVFSDHLLIWNFIFAVIIVFFQRRDPKSVWGWLLLLYFLPGLGFVFYLLCGQDFHKRKMFRAKEVEERLYEEVRRQEGQLLTKEKSENKPEIEGFKDLVIYNMETSNAMLTSDNDVDIFIEGMDKFNALKEDLRKAKYFIHMQYYIIKDDVLFNEIKEILTAKAKEGVEVRIMYDAMGSRFTSRKKWRELNEKGIMTAEFFPALFGRLHIRANYRNHRKIVVVDNKVAYVGGYNIGKEYIGLDKKFGHWRDTHLRIRGSAVMALQLRFILDWNYATKEKRIRKELLIEHNEAGTRDHCDIQIISSGPDHTTELIRDNYLRLITKAKKSIYIQTPYFIPDESVLRALMIAVKSGIEVNIMIPCMPDHPFVYWATYSYVGALVLAGANCYTYDNGFLHSKGLIVDGKVFCYGTANMDIRSFALNFEVNAVVYDQKKAKEMEEIFHKDLESSTRITKEAYEARSLSLRFKEQICRLLSPVL